MPNYDELAKDYHWLFSDRISTGELFLEENKDVLSSARKDARILDCSCGIGTFPVALGR